MTDLTAGARNVRWPATVAETRRRARALVPQWMPFQSRCSGRNSTRHPAKGYHTGPLRSEASMVFATGPGTPLHRGSLRLAPEEKADKPIPAHAAHVPASPIRQPTRPSWDRTISNIAESAAQSTGNMLTDVGCHLPLPSMGLLDLQDPRHQLRAASGPHAVHQPTDVSASSLARKA